MIGINPFTRNLEFTLKLSKTFIILTIFIHIIAILAVIFTKTIFIFKLFFILTIIINLFYNYFNILKYITNKIIIIYDKYMEENQIILNDKKIKTKNSYVSTYFIILRLIDDNVSFFKKYDYILVFFDAVDKKTFRKLKIHFLHNT
jgi:hypothetical protein